MDRNTFWVRKQLGTDKPTWHAFYRDGDHKMQRICNSEGRPIAYASEEAATAQAREHHETAIRKTIT